VSQPGGRWLDRIERVGNALPHPATLFLLGALAVMALSQVAAVRGWTVEKTLSVEVRLPLLDAGGQPIVDPATGAPLTRLQLDPESGEPSRELVVVPVRATGLLTSEGLYWCLESLVDNFKNFPPLAIVLVGMLGIGVAERSGFIATLLRASLQRVRPGWLTPATFLLGVLSSMALDAGYVVLPPVAAALYHAASLPRSTTRRGARLWRASRRSSRVCPPASAPTCSSRGSSPSSPASARAARMSWTPRTAWQPRATGGS
jgi:aminobenzoyl-glutamate transport protein